MRLADPPKEDPWAEAELRAVVAEARALLSAGTAAATDHMVVAGRDVNVSVSGDRVAPGVIHGDVAPPGPTRPGSAAR